jgi:uncharacterized protein
VTAVDSNVLIAAHRREHPNHQAARRRLEMLAEGDSPWGLIVFCIIEFLRVVTHPRVFAPPSTLEMASSFIDRLTESPSVRWLTPGEHFWDTLRDVAAEAGASGNLLFDAQIAAVCRDAGALHLVTSDRDFARFRFLTTEAP